MKRFSCKPIAILTAVFFLSNGIFIPSSFASVNELILNEAQQPVQTLTLEQANAQTFATENAIPSGVAIQNENPLSLATPSVQPEGESVPEGAIQVHEGESIQTAIDQAQAGDTVYLHAGIYHESITLKQGVNLTGEDSSAVILDGQGQFTNVILARGDNVIRGITVKGGGAYSGGPKSAVRIEGNNVILRDSKVLDNADYGVYLRSGDNILLEGVLFKNNHLAIQHPHAAVTHVVIRYNTLVNNSIGINLLGGVTPRIENNIITGSTFCAIYEFNWAAYANGQLSRGFATVENNTFFSNAWKPTAYGSSTPPAVANQTGGNVTADPKFIDPSNGNYQLLPDSPASGRGAFPVIWSFIASNANYLFQVREEGSFEKLWLLNLVTGQETEAAALAGGGEHPSFQEVVDISPDGSTVIYGTRQSADEATAYVQRINAPLMRITSSGVLQTITFISGTENVFLDFQDGKSLLVRIPASSSELPLVIEEHKPNGVTSYFNLSDGALERVAIQQTDETEPLPSIEIVRPAITQVPLPSNGFTIKFDQAMRGVRYEIQYRTSLVSGDWQFADSFVADHYGATSWQDPAPDRGSTVFYRIVAKEMTTAADLLTQINLLYFDPAFGLVESTHEYPAEGWLQQNKTQPSNFGFFAYLLATIAAGDLVTSKISKTQAISRFDTMMDHLLEDQANTALCYKGLFPWFEYSGSDWTRMSGSYGQQVSFEDNTNFTNALAVAYGALLDETLAGNATIHGSGGILAKIDTFIANQEEGYSAMYNTETNTFAQTMQISDGSLSGGIVLFGAESSAPLLFLILQYGDAFPGSAYAKLNFETRTYTMQDLTTREVVAPFSGAFQMYWPALLMPESENPDLWDMLETYTDVQLDFANRNDQPGLLSAAYDVQAHDLLRGSMYHFSWASDNVTGGWESNRYHLTSPTTHGIGVSFHEAGLDAAGLEMQFRYSSTTVIPGARLEFKKTVNGVQHIFTYNLPTASTGGAVVTEKFTLPSDEWLNDLDEIVFATSDGSSSLDMSLYSFLLMDDTYQIVYNFPLGISEIATGGTTVETTPSVYNLGAAYMFRPAEVEALLQGLIADHRDLVSAHGLWEGKNMDYDQVVQEQVFNNVTTFVLGMTGTGPSYITRYFENKDLTAELDSIWNSQTPVSVTGQGTASNFEWDVYKGTSWKLNESVRASDRQIRITYQSDTTITGAKFDLKYSSSGNDPVYSVLFDLPATGGVPGEVILAIPENFLYWYITEMVVVFPAANGYPSATISRMVLAPEGVVMPPVVVLDAATPALINTRTLTVNYTVEGVAKTKLFEGLVEGANTLSITAVDVPGLLTPVTWSVTVDTIPPVIVMDSKNPSVIATTAPLVIYYTAQGILKTQTFNGLTSGMNALLIEETDLAGNRTTVSFNVLVDPTAHDFLKDQLGLILFDGGSTGSLTWGIGYLLLTCLNFHGFGFAAITPGIDVVGKQMQFRYVSSVFNSTAKVEFKKKDAFGVLKVVGARYFDIENTNNDVRTVDLGVIPPGIPNDLDEVAFVVQGAGGLFVMEVHDFILYDPSLAAPQAAWSGDVPVTPTAILEPFEPVPDVAVAPPIVSLPPSSVPSINPRTLFKRKGFYFRFPEQPKKGSGEHVSVMPKATIWLPEENKTIHPSQEASAKSRKKKSFKERLPFRSEASKREWISAPDREPLVLMNACGGPFSGTAFCLLGADSIAVQD